ncbi:MAG TPA: hypothetical protein VFJ16_28575 [Longimicrobium sp.]|nr:hypothetical protein [Longimicrobium sp.]
MITFKRQQSGLYLTAAGDADPSQARVGFLFQDASRTDATFELTQENWTKPELQGYFAFFAPATRDWNAFAARLREVFAGTPPSQFGWFTGEGADAAAATLILVANQGTATPFVQTSYTLNFAGNVTLVQQANPFNQAVIRFDDGSNTFQFANTQGIQLSATAPGQPTQQFASTSSSLLLPMDDAPAAAGGNPHAGSVNAAFSLAATDLEAFEAGFMYFGPGEAGVLTALRYPAFVAAGGTPQTAMGFSGWFDVLGPLDGTRTYLQFTDPTVGSYFTTSRGSALTLATSNGNAATTTRLVFANRPVNQPTDTGTSYLTPAGTFPLAAGGVDDRGNLLCGVTGTEFLDVAVGGATPDALVLRPGEAAFQKLTPATGVGNEPAYLDSMGGNVTTSWVQLVTTGGSYVSQPQESPLYQQPSTQAAMLAGAAPESGLSVYLLDFLPLPTWQPATAGNGNGAAAAAAAPAQAPPVPMVPYAGLRFGTPGESAPFLSMESTALNPTRKNQFTAAQLRLNNAARSAGLMAAADTPADEVVVRYAMTPQGLLAGLDVKNTWTTTQIAISPALSGVGTDTLQITQMGEQVRQALQQNQTFLVISTLNNPNTQPQQLFQFAGADQTLNIAGWPFSLSPMGTRAPDGTPPILIMKFYPGQSIADLVNDVSLWSQPYVFNDTFTPQQAQAYLQGMIQQACENVYGKGKCPGGVPSGQPDTTSLYYNFYKVVTDPAFSGVLAVNANMQLNNLPTAIRAVTGGMTVPGKDGPVSTIDQFRVHHVGVAINDTDPNATTPTLAQSSLFGLVDYEKPAAPPDSGGGASLDVSYNFEVEYLRALFTNSELTRFSCLINLTINNLFGTPVTLNQPSGAAVAAAAAGDGKNVVKITGSYQAHSTSGDDTTSGQGVYSFVAEGDFAFTFGENPYLDNITLTKLQFSFLQETKDAPTAPAGGGTTSTIQASFGIWGKMVFKKFDVLDIFAFKQLVFNDLGIAVQFDLTTYAATIPPAPPPPSPTTGNLKLTFSPGNLRLDVAASPPREGDTSMLRLLPFKLTSFFYNEFPEQQTLEKLQYIALASVPLGNGLTLTNQFNYGLAFELDLGSWGALAGPLQAFRFSFMVGWLTENGGAGKIAFGVQLPEANGKLEITIQGVLQLVIQQFILKYNTGDDGKSMLVLALHNSFIQILGQRLPPGENQFFDFALFAPIDDASRIGWIAAVSTQAGGTGGTGASADVMEALPPNWRIFPDGVRRLEVPAGLGVGAESGSAPSSTPASRGAAGEALAGGHAVTAVATREETGGDVTVHLPPQGWAVLTDQVSGRTLHGRGGGRALAGPAGGPGGEGEKSPVFQLVYLGLGQRTGPDPRNPPTTFKSFLSFMQTDFWNAVSKGEYDKVYHPDGQWLALTQFKLLGVVEVGFIFYDVTPFYSLTLTVEKLFSFEITYTKISDTIGLFYATLALPDTLRTFQVGAASLTLPSLAVSVYTNGDWKLDVGFPAGNDWSRSFRVQAQAGPVPVTGSGGFYIASLSSATTDVFKGSYPSIVAFGFAARLGVGKDFVAGPLKAGVSVTFFGIIQGAAGYLSSGNPDIFRTPDALQLQGQFGIIGELYGSIDFVIIKASVNVRLQASIGVILTWERSIPSSGSILLYIEASVSVSVKVEIDLGLFSITISFSFRASFRFEWQLLRSGSNQALLLQRGAFAARRTMLMAMEAVPVLPLLAGLNSDLGLWFLPEGTVVFPAATGTGTPWLATTLGIRYYPGTYTTPPAYDQFQPFEAATAQLVTWAVGHALERSGGAYTVTQNEVAALDQTPEALVGWIDYPTLLLQLAVFSTTTLTLPPQDQAGTGYASTFPMPPFLQIQTTGRQNGAGGADEMDYVFSSKNNVTTDYIAEVDAYFNQLFVNQQNAGAGRLTATMLAAATVPLVQEIFLNYFTGLVRGGLHAVLQIMQDGRVDEGRIDTLIQAAVGAGQFQSLAGQMSSSFRGGARLPYTSGLTVPGGQPLTTTNPLYALLWQEFPVGSLGTANEYTVALTNPDGQQKWITSTASWKLTAEWLKPFAEAKATDVKRPTAPVQLPFTDVGPQSFAFQNAVVWTQPGGATPTLFPFPGNLSQLQATGTVPVLVQSRATGAAYLPGGTALPAGQFTWATQLSLTAAQIPGASGQPLDDVFALSGASQADQELIEQILDAGTGQIAALQVLYQAAAGQSGLRSDAVDGNAVFVLRTNTTTVSAPPAGVNTMMLAEAEPEPAGVPVGADLADLSGFLWIVQQAAVTNAPGYYLRYLNRDGKSLPTTLFTAGPAPLTLLVTWKPDGTQNTPASPARVQPYYNAVVIGGVDTSLLYYADTANPALSTQYGSVAAGSVGVLLTQSEADALLQPHPRLAPMLAGANAASPRGWRRSELVAALVQAGVTDAAEVRAALADSGSGAGQLNALYSLLTYQVQATAGFVRSNLSAPVQPQQPDEGSSAADGLRLAGGDGGDTSSFRVYAPLYAVATANQGVTTRPANRYASIGQPVSIGFYQNDVFGNQMPGELDFSSTNLYFDPIVPVDEWQGVSTDYDFTGGAAATLNVTLRPDPTAFAGLSLDEAAAALQGWYTIQDQLTGPGVTMAVETNLALQGDGSMAKTTLAPAQMTLVLAMVQEIVAYLEKLSTGGSPAFDVRPVPLAVAVSGPGALPPVFEMVVLLGIERDKGLISPLLIRDGVVTFPSAQNRYSSVVATVGASIGGRTVQITDFAAAFVQSFSALVLSVGLGGATEAGPPASSAGRHRAALREAGVASDGSGAGKAAAQSLWAVQASLVGITVGQGTGTGPFYLSPTPLDNTLNTAVVPLPGLPSELTPPNWAAQQLFTDVDLDRLNTTFFAAVDGFLAPASASRAFQAANPAYTTVATGRRSLANLFSKNEVDWLFDDGAPFTGTDAARTEARKAFGEQMRAALATAYAVDTVVQYGVRWTSPLPAGVGDLYSLYGTVRPVGGTELPRGFTISASQVEVNPSGPGLLTFLFGVADVQNTPSVELGLEFNVTHVQHFTEPKPAGDEARSSIWLQLVNPYPGGAPVVGTGRTEIPLVFRQYPTPPTLVSQTGMPAAANAAAGAQNPITAAAAWYLQYQYQAQLTARDQLASSVTYNTNLSAGSGGSGGMNAMALAEAETLYTLFEALARFSATWPVLMPVLGNLDDPNWAAAAGVFAGLVNEVVRNTTWTPPPPPPPQTLMLARSLASVTDPYTIIDRVQNSGPQRLITLTWNEQESSFPSATLSIVAVDPAGVEYPNQVPGTIPGGITDLYTPVPELVNDWVSHRVEVDGLNVLAAENALAGVQVERNVIRMGAGGNEYVAKGEFIYRTPLVRATQPVTPFVDYPDPIDVASLPLQGGDCPTATTPPGIPGLCQRIYAMMYALLADEPTSNLLAAQARARANEARARANKAGAQADEAGAPRRVKVSCGFRYPVSSAGGVVSANPVSPVVPVSLARSFVIDGTRAAQLSDFSGLFATAIAQWAADNQVTLGPAAQGGSQFVFDITLYAQISGVNTPVLRLRTLWLALTAIAV